MASSSFHLPDSPPAGYVFPPRAGSSASTREPAANVHLTALKADTRHVAIVVTETTSRAPPKLHITPPSQCIPPPPPGPPPFSSDSRPSTPPVRNDPTLQLTPPENGANTQSNRSSPTLMRNGSAASNHYEDDTVTPVMRSMFPRFDTAQPVPQPHLLSQPPPAALVRNSTGGYSPSLYSQRSPPMEMDPWAANRLSSLMIPRVSSVRITEEPSPSASNTEQLLELWNVANGQGSENPEDYVLNLECNSLTLDHEQICFSSPSGPLYILHASGSTLILQRRHPVSTETEVTVCKPYLCVPTTITPLLATIFPSLAELLAIDQASSLAFTHRLPRHESISLQTDAIGRAHAAEAASLLWDSDSGNYFLAHPSLTSSNPDTSVAATLPIEIIPGNSITIISTRSEPLVSLDLDGAVLTIHTAAVIALSPSCYALDTLVSSVLTLLLHLHRHTALLRPRAEPLPHFDPPPSALGMRSNRSSLRNSTASKKAARKAQKPKSSRWLSIGHRSSDTTTRTASWPSPSPSTLANSPPPSHDHYKDLEAGIILPPISIPPSGVAPELRKENTGVDLSRFQAFDLEDPELSKGTRGALRIVYWLFSVLVWVLGVVIGCVAAFIVAIGSCVGGKGITKAG